MTVGPDPDAIGQTDETEDVLIAAAAMDDPPIASIADAASVDPDEILATARVIDDFFGRARHEKAAQYGAEASAMVEEMFGLADQFTAVAFVEAYRAGQVYPEDRLRELVLRFTDVRLQEWYIQFDTGMANQSYYAPIHLNPDMVNSARLTLSLMATTQSIIARSRIAWEKLMRAVYYLETGLDLRPSGSRSYKSKFFDWVGGQPRWLFLEPYKSVVTEHDDRFRTGEFHKGSILRRVVLGHDMPDLNEIMNLSNYMMNSIWNNILSIVRGDWPDAFTDLHFNSTGQIDSRYLPPDGDIGG